MQEDPATRISGIVYKVGQFVRPMFKMFKKSRIVTTFFNFFHVKENSPKLAKENSPSLTVNPKQPLSHGLLEVYRYTLSPALNFMCETIFVEVTALRSSIFGFGQRPSKGLSGVVPSRTSR